jgi:hypothetical protein
MVTGATRSRAPSAYQAIAGFKSVPAPGQTQAAAVTCKAYRNAIGSQPSTTLTVCSIVPRPGREHSVSAVGRSHRQRRSGEKIEKNRTNLGSRDESQRIAAWKLLYRVRHPGPCVSRLQTIPHSDVGSSRNLDSKETGSTCLQGAPTDKGIRVAPDASASGFSHRTATGVPRQTAASRSPQRR